MEEGRLESKTTVAWINSLLVDIYNVERDKRKRERREEAAVANYMKSQNSILLEVTSRQSRTIKSPWTFVVFI